MAKSIRKQNQGNKIGNFANMMIRIKESSFVKTMNELGASASYAIHR